MPACRQSSDSPSRPAGLSALDEWLASWGWLSGTGSRLWTLRAPHSNQLHQASNESTKLRLQWIARQGLACNLGTDGVCTTHKRLRASTIQPTARFHNAGVCA
jgi:hypothetical protein